MSTIANKTHQGACYCGLVTYTITGHPSLSAYCHCSLCQRLNSAPFIHTLHFPSTAITWTGSDVVDAYQTLEKPWKKRIRCKTCGCCVASHNSKTNKSSVWGAQLARDEHGKIIGWEELKPTAHIFYGTRMLDVEDGLPKWEGYAESSRRIS